MRRRPGRWVMVGGTRRHNGCVAVALVMVACLLVSCTGGASSQRDGSAAAKDGSLALTRAGYRFSAPAGAFDAGQAVSIQSAPVDVKSLGAGRFVLPPAQVRTSKQPGKPVTFETAVERPPDPSLTVAVAWSDSGEATLLASEVAGSTLRAQSPHLSVLGFVTFPTPADLQIWLADQFIDAAVRYLKNFFNLPFECETLRQESKLVSLYATPGASVNLQVSFTDHPTQPDTLVLQICNKLRWVTHFIIGGVASARGFALGRTDFPFELRVAGQRGDIVTFDALFDPDAFTGTLAYLVLEAFGQIVGVSDPAAGLVLNAKTVSTIETVTQSCRSVIETAIGSSSPDPLMAAWSCVKQLDDFRALVMDLLVGVAAKRGLALTGATSLHLAAIMGGQAFNRVIAETWLFGLPNPYSFQLRLLCPPGRVCEDPTTTSTSTTSTTSMTVPPAAVVLAVDSLGVVPFRTDMEEAIAVLTASLGSPTTSAAGTTRTAARTRVEDA